MSEVALDRPGADFPLAPNSALAFWRHPLKIVVRLREDPFFANSVSLMLNSSVLTVLGALFWVLCARLYTPEEVGVATALLAVLNLVTSVSLLGFEVTLIRYLATRENQLALLCTMLLVVSVVSVVVGLAAVVVVPDLTPQLSVLRTPWFGLFFVIFGPVSAASYLLESTFIAVRHSNQVVHKNIVFSVAKIGLVQLLARLGAAGIYVSWLLALGVASAISFRMIGRRVQVLGSISMAAASLRGLMRFSLANYTSAFAEGLPVMVLPLLVIRFYGKAASAHYYLAMTICSMVFMIAVASAQSLFSEGSRTTGSFRAHLLKAVLLTFGLTIPAAAAVVLYGTRALQLLGNGYGSGTEGMLRLLAISALPMTVGWIALTALKVQNANIEVAIISTVGALSILALCFAFRPLGLTGIGLAWLIGQLLSMSAMLLALLRLHLRQRARANLYSPAWRLSRRVLFFLGFFILCYFLEGVR